MLHLLDNILNRIKEKNPNHALKLEANLGHLGSEFKRSADVFFEQYQRYLNENGMDLDFGIDCYLHMIEDMLQERLRFIREGKYTNTSFEEVEKRVYGNSQIMTYHMHGLVLAQFLWFDQYERILFFKTQFPKYFDRSKSYLEVGGGHGLYAFEAYRMVPGCKKFDLVDISESSLELAKGVLNNNEIHFHHKNIFDFNTDDKYDFITMGEVLEHLENPMEMLGKIWEMLTERGICYVTTPINAPMIDHIYLFSNEEEIRQLFDRAGFAILEEKIVISEKITEKQAAKFKVPIMYAAFIQKK